MQSRASRPLRTPSAERPASMRIAHKAWRNSASCSTTRTLFIRTAGSDFRSTGLIYCTVNQQYFETACGGGRAQTRNAVNPWTSGRSCASSPSRRPPAGRRSQTEERTDVFRFLGTTCLGAVSKKCRRGFRPPCGSLGHLLCWSCNGSGTRDPKRIGKR